MIPYSLYIVNHLLTNRALMPRDTQNMSKIWIKYIDKQPCLVYNIGIQKFLRKEENTMTNRNASKNFRSIKINVLTSEKNNA